VFKLVLLLVLVIVIEPTRHESKIDHEQEQEHD
jgi:hypothetical protein